MLETLGNGQDTGGLPFNKLIVAVKWNAEMKFRLKNRFTPEEDKEHMK